MRKYIFFLLTLSLLLPSCKKDKKSADATVEGSDRYEKIDFEYDFMPEIDKVQMNKDIDTIKAYCKRNNLKPKKTKSGLFYIITDEGDGKAAEARDIIWIHSDGKTLDGKKFYNTRDHKTPLEFQLGLGQMIPAFDEGIQLFKEGEKGKLIVPSQLAYGKKGIPKVLPPNTNMIFDIEIVKVTPEQYKINKVRPKKQNDLKSTKKSILTK